VATTSLEVVAGAQITQSQFDEVVTRNIDIGPVKRNYVRNE